MRKIIQAESTLTDRYQTTIPESIRESLHLHKRDKITYTIDETGNVLLSRTNKEDPVLDQFLSFLANDIKNNHSHIRSISPMLMERAQNLVSGVEVDLDAPLDYKDE